MYFAVSPWAATTLAQLTAEVESTRATAEPCHAIALVDLAFDATWLNAPRWRRAPRCSLYEAGRLAELSPVGLWIVPLSGLAPTVAEALSALQQVVSGKPMFSVLLSALSPEALASYWQPFLQARTADGLDWPVRWGDTRVSPHLLNAMTDAERGAFLAPLHAWLTVDRSGQLQQWCGAGQSAPVAWQDSVWALDDERFGQLVDVCEADAVISRIDDQRPDLLKHHTPLACHRRVAQCLNLANRGGLQAAPDRHALSMIGLNLDEAFMQHPAFERLLNNTRAGASFAQEIKALPDDFWDACARQDAVA